MAGCGITWYHCFRNTWGLIGFDWFVTISLKNSFAIQNRKVVAGTMHYNLSSYMPLSPMRIVRMSALLRWEKSLVQLLEPALGPASIYILSIPPHKLCGVIAMGWGISMHCRGVIFSSVQVFSYAVPMISEWSSAHHGPLSDHMQAEADIIQSLIIALRQLARTWLEQLLDFSLLMRFLRQTLISGEDSGNLISLYTWSCGARLILKF